MNLNSEIYNILVIDDDLSEQKLIKMIIKSLGYNYSLNFLNDGEEALSYISQFSSNETFKKLHLILLDLNLPRVRGVQVLQELKNNEYFKKVPVVILTTSNNISDITLAYEYGASGYIRKPSVFEDYENAIRNLLYYWFELCLIP